MGRDKARRSADIMRGLRIVASLGRHFRSDEHGDTGFCFPGGDAMAGRDRKRQLWCLCSCAVVSVLAAGAGPGQTHDHKSGSVRVVILQGPQASYEDAAASLERSLTADGYTCVRLTLPPRRDGSKTEAVMKNLATSNATVIAAAGARATSLALKAVPKTPVVFFMVPNALDAPFMTDELQRSRVTGVTSDVPPGKQIDWIKRLRPSGGSIGVLYSDHTKRTADAIVQAGRQRGITIKTLLARRKAFPEAIDALNKSGCDGVLMIPDAGVYNGPNVQRLLLWGIRQKKPVWTFSPKLVKAGALAGQHTQPEAIGRQAAGVVTELANGADSAKMGLVYPVHTSDAVNVRTASMIGLRFSSSVLEKVTKRYGVE